MGAWIFSRPVSLPPLRSQPLLSRPSLSCLDPGTGRPIQLNGLLEATGGGTALL